MAAIVTVVGGMIGFVMALLSLFLGVSLLAALGLWIGTGLSCAALAGLFALLPRGPGHPARA